MVQVLLAGAFCGAIYLGTVLTVGRNYLAYVTIPAVFVLWYLYVIIFGIPAFILAGIASLVYRQIDIIRGWHWHIPIVLALAAGGILVCWSMDQMVRVPEILGLPAAFWGLPVLGTLVLYPVASVFVRGDGRASVLFFGSSAAICSVFSWGFAAAFGGRETVLGGIRSVVDQILSPYRVSHYVSDAFVLYGDVIVVTLVILACLVLAEHLSRTRPFEALKSRTAKRS